MIVFKKIKWRNFLSTGNHYTEINLNEVSNTLIIGSNGAGKSTFLDALTFGLFNKPFRKINKPQLVNSTNDSDCVVEIEFEIGSIDWKVVRGMKPNIFEIYKNGKKLAQSSDIKEDQKLLEQTILKLNYKSFTQIVILGSSNFIPFMQLTAASRREVIEDLLDIRIFSSMNDIVKNKLKEIREDLKTFYVKKELFQDKVKMQNNFIEELEKRGFENINEKKSKIEELNENEIKISSENDNLGKDLANFTEELEIVSDATTNLKKLVGVKGKISQKISSILKAHKFFTDNTVCPTCTQSIDESFRLNKLETTEKKSKELHDGYKELEDTIQKEEDREKQFISLSKKITSITHEISQNNLRISGFKRQVKDLRSEIQDIANKIENQNIEHEKLEKYEEDLLKIQNTIDTTGEELNHYDFIYQLLKDGGVKTKIIKHYLPVINRKVNEYLQLLDFYINFSLDEEFNENVISPIHENFSYSSFSEGEKMRIDLALLFTWREIARIKNSVNTNLLILDEVFDSSLDGFGTDEFLKIIRYIIKDANIFIISHKSELNDKFESVIKFDKVRGFSAIV
jgi:DNA repair exonuclease SbcCD ATPase subunit